MVTKMKKSADAEDATPKSEGARMNSSVRDSAQQIWQAGLGAFAKAQAEGTRAFEALVKEGSAMQRKTQAAAEEKISEATSRVSSMASDISSKASGHWDKLETIFEERVSKAMGKLGVPSAKDMDALNARIDALTKKVQAMSRAPARKAPAKAAAKSPAKKAARPAAPRKVPARRKTT